MIDIIGKKIWQKIILYRNKSYLNQNRKIVNTKI